MKSLDLTERKVIALSDLQSVDAAGELLVREGVIITPSARDFIRQKGLVVRNGAKPQPAPGTAPAAASSRGQASAQASPEDRLFYSPEAEALKAEMIAVGRKLWQRSYVDGNGGNISCRLGPHVMCTPTLMSKADLRPEDLCLVDMQGNQLIGQANRTSEVLLHLEIYKNVPEAQAVVHCHPPHATAYAITGRVPPNCVIPEYEVFIGKVALAPYETPGTQRFAETVIPYVKTHNTVLLANHGIVCWGDTITHAEWYAEVVDTYCWTLMLAAQLGAPISHIPTEKAPDLLAMKKKLALPDPRLESGMQECQLCDLPEIPGAIAIQPRACEAPRGKPCNEEVEALVQSVTDAVMAALTKTRL